MRPDILRAWWFHRQGLDQPSKLSAHDVLERTGWARSVGGSNPYLTLFSRARLGRTAIDKAVAEQEIHELPSARGCTYVVPRSQFALALTVGQPAGDAPDLVTAKKFLGVTETEIKTLEDSIVKALSKSEMDPRQLKEQLGSAVRSLGEEGKKRGTTTTLPLALGRLQNNGRIRRISTDGRVDNQRYKYAVWDPSPLEAYNSDKDQAFVDLAQLYFRWIGPATLANFQWFSGLGVGASKKAVERLKLVPVEAGSDLLILPEDVDAFNSFKTPDDERIALVASIDALLLLRRNVTDYLDEADSAQKMQGDKALYTVGNVMDLSNHAIFDRGRLIGLWEYDPESSEIAWKTFTTPSQAVKRAVKEMESFARDQLGDVRSFSLDSPASRKNRIAFLRKG